MTMPRLPVPSDFPEKVQVLIIDPPNKDPPTNGLLLLHGLGDRPRSFADLGSRMKLPETVCVAIQGAQPLLGFDGFHWGDDLVFDSSDGGLDMDAGFERSTALLKSLIVDVMVGRCGFVPRNLFCFGFGQGGMAALDLAVALHHQSQCPALGGIISVGAGLSNRAPASLDSKIQTPVLVCAGITRSCVTASAEEKLRHVIESVTVRRYRRPGDGMPTNRDEMIPIMEFLSRRLQAVKGVLPGSVEISNDTRPE